MGELGASYFFLLPGLSWARALCLAPGLTAFQRMWLPYPSLLKEAEHKRSMAPNGPSPSFFCAAASFQSGFVAEVVYKSSGLLLQSAPGRNLQFPSNRKSANLKLCDPRCNISVCSMICDSDNTHGSRTHNAHHRRLCAKLTHLLIL